MVQNKALRFISGTFHMTPTYSLELECSIPLIHKFLNYINDRAALHFSRLNSQHLISIHLPDEHCIHPTPLSPPLNPPHKKSRNWSNPACHAADRAKELKCTTLWWLAEQMVPNIKVINASAKPPWHESIYDKTITGQFKVQVPHNEAGKSFKKTWVKLHHDRITELELDNAHLLIYMDRSLSYKNGVHHTGAGYVIYRGRVKVHENGIALGKHVEVYNTEMEGLTCVAEAVKGLLATMQEARNIKSIHFFTDNTRALQRIHKGMPGKAQDCSWHF
jgi:hypothetical protein